MVGARQLASCRTMRTKVMFLVATAMLASSCRSSTTSDTPLIATANASPPPAAAQLDPARGSELGLVFESYLSPEQEPEEESQTPKTTPEQFRSTTASMTRAERVEAKHRGHGQLRFNKDLSRAFVDVRIEGIDPKTINMFHIHCGMPGILGPILLDFSHATDIPNNFTDDGVFSVEITNEHLVATSEHGHGLISAFTAGCVIPSPSLGSVAPTKVSTVAGMAQIARQGELYFNLHTTGQTYYGDIRGQLHRAE
jgi:hypothetical protein